MQNNLFTFSLFTISFYLLVCPLEEGRRYLCRNCASFKIKISRCFLAFLVCLLLFVRLLLEEGESPKIYKLLCIVHLKKSIVFKSLVCFGLCKLFLIVLLKEKRKKSAFFWPFVCFEMTLVRGPLFVQFPRSCDKSKSSVSSGVWLVKLICMRSNHGNG